MAVLTTGVTPERKHNLAAQLSGSEFPAQYAGINVPGHGRMFGIGDALPSAESGWGKAALFLHTDGTSGDLMVYVNTGDTTSSTFVSVASISGGDFGSGGLLADLIAESTSAAGVTIGDQLIALGGTQTLMISVPDGAAYTVLAANSGKVHLILDQAQDVTLTLPTAAAGLYYEFWSTMVAADNFDWLIITGSDTNFYLGGLVFHDSDNADGVPLLASPNGTDDATIQVILPSSGTLIKMYCDGTNWFMNGMVFSVTIPTFT